MKPSERQVGGTHYSKMVIQPAEYAVANRLGPLELLIVRYISRWRNKGGFQDLDKIIHVVELMKELETKYGQTGSRSPPEESCGEGPRFTEVSPANYRA